MDNNLPMKTTFLCTAQFGLRIKPDLKDRIRRLKGLGVDTAAIIRDAIEEAVDKAEGKAS